MSRTLAITRTNLFKVNDEAAFRKWADAVQLSILEEDINNQKHFCLYLESPEYALSPDWPTSRLDENEDEVEIDFHDELSGHLQEGSIALLLHCDIDGDAFIARVEAIDSKGGYLVTRLHDIYELAERTFNGTAETLSGAGS